VRPSWKSYGTQTQGSASWPKKPRRDEALPLDAEDLWIVDPSCGSLNYVQGIPYFRRVNALATHAAPIRVGAVFDRAATRCSARDVSSHSKLNGATIGVQQNLSRYEASKKPGVALNWPARPGALRSGHADRRDHVAAGPGAERLGSPALFRTVQCSRRPHARHWALELKTGTSPRGLIRTPRRRPQSRRSWSIVVCFRGRLIASNSISPRLDPALPAARPGGPKSPADEPRRQSRALERRDCDEAEKVDGGWRFRRAPPVREGAAVCQRG